MDGGCLINDGTMVAFALGIIALIAVVGVVFIGYMLFDSYQMWKIRRLLYDSTFINGCDYSGGSSHDSGSSSTNNGD